MRLLILCLFGLATAAENGPINKVVDLLKDLHKQVTEEGEAETKLNSERVEAQRVRRDELEDNIQDETRHIDKYKSEIESADADVESFGTTIVENAQKIAANEKEAAEDKEARAAAKKEFQAKEAEMTEAVDTLTRAKSVLKRAMSGGQSVTGAAKAELLQIAGTVEVLIKASSISMKGKTALTAMMQGASNDDDFLQEADPAGAPAAAAYESHAGSIVDMVAQLEVEAKQQLADLRRAESENKHASAMTQQGLADGLKILERDLANAKKEKGAREEDGAKNRAALADEEAALKDDSAELEELNSTAAREKEEFEAHTHDRSEELAAVSKAIEILTDDKFQAATSLLQTESHDGDIRSRIAAMLQEQAGQFKSRALAQLASRTRVGNDTFAKIRGMISDMITRLEEEAAKEASHHEWCEAEKKESDAKKEKLSAKIEDLSARIQGVAADIAQLKEDIATLQGELAASAQALQDATKTRQEEAEQFAKDTADYAAAEQGLSSAITVLSEYYAKGGSQGAKTEASSSIIGILEVAQSDFSKMDAEARTAEAAAAKSYKELKQKTEVSTAQKEAEIKTKEAAVKSQESANADYKEDLDGLNEELEAVLKYLETVREKCTHKPQTFEERAAKMQAEIAGLKSALEILENETAGAAEFLQKRMITKHM